jgi:uncharacterized OB-fold protein
MTMDRIRPIPDADGADYYEGLRRGELLLKHCRDCDRVHFYPRELCPHCFSDALDWKHSPGKGEIYSFTIVRRPPPAMKDKAPYVVGLVTLDEGPRMMAHIVGCAPEQVHIGQRVRIGFERIDDELTLPQFIADL